MGLIRWGSGAQTGHKPIHHQHQTIYDHAHIGNFRSFLFYDLVHRYLEWSGYDVQFVMNLTDVDDKTIAGAVEAGVSVEDYTTPFGEILLDDAKTPE